MTNPSLILPQSPAFGEDFVYAAQVYDGDVPVYDVLPLTFTRASNGTRINSAGLIEVTPWNLLQYSEQFDNGVWVQNNNIVTSNSIIAPNGTTTGETISNSATTALFRTYQYISGYGQPQTLTFSTYFKYKDHRYISFGLTDDSNYRSQVVIDLQNMVITQNYKSNSGDVLTSTIESVGNGWYKVVGTLTYNTALAGGNLYLLYKFQTSGTFSSLSTLQTGTGFYIWGAQINIGSTAQPYLATTDRLNMPRVTYPVGGGCGALLLEKQRTNLVTYSEQIDNVAWGKTNVTITANNTASPDGYTNADKVVANTTNGVHRIEQNLATATQVATQCVFAKASGYNFIAVENGGEIAYFNISTGAVGTVSGGTASIENYGNGWYRCIFTATALNTKSYIYISNTDNNISFAGDNTSGAFIWGCQFEASASYATSYIPTTTASATRVADLAVKSSISSLFGASATSFFMDFEITQASNGGNWTVTGWDGTNLFSLCQFDNASNFPRIVFDGGVDITLGTALSIGRHKIAVSFATNDFRAYIDGVLVHTDTSCTYNRYDRIAVNGTAWTGNTNNTNSFKLNEYAQFPNVLTNAELASLTTI